ncbi:MAG TPA: hypothetical protein VNO52_02450, partial [Methylomirabilota bacterium]|nr:hypothetical protein [Methylomirabilota bacterium]
PLDDLVAERVETIVIALAPSADYSAVQPGLVSVALLDDEAPVLEVAPGDTNMFELHAADTGSFTITRLGETNIEIFAVNYLLSGAAEPGIDYTLPGELGGFTLAAGVVDYSLLVTPIDDSENEGDETITLTLDPDSPEYQVGASASATIRIRDNELPPARVLFADDFDSGAGENWTQVFGANNGIFDATVAFGHDYSQNGVGSAPRSSGGTTRGLFIQVNKQDATPGGSAAVNLYPTGREFRGNYALRFDMLLNFGAASTTEHALAGLNHSGLLTNRVTQSVDTNNTTRGGDGIWVAIETDGSANREYGAYSYSAPGSAPGLLTNRSAAAMSPFIPAPPYAFAGSPGNQGSGGNRVWAQVELRQLYGRIGLLINRALVYEFPNTSGFSAGTVMIGHNDQFDSIGSPEAYVLFDNVEVVSLDLEITGVSFPDGAMALDFVAPLGGAASSFTVESSPVLPATDWEPEPATIEATPTGFRAVIPRPNATRFLRIRN